MREKRVELLQGTLDMLVLRTLQWGAQHGYAISQTIRSQSAEVLPPRQLAEAPPLGRCVVTDARLSHLTGGAYGVTVQNLRSDPDWIQRGDLRFNVQAKAEDPTRATEQQLLAMMQNLLVELQTEISLRKELGGRVRPKRCEERPQTKDLEKRRHHIVV